MHPTGADAPKEDQPMEASKSAIAKLAKDPVSRRKFMALTGGSTAMGAVLAACGSSDDSSTTSSTSSATSTDTRPPADMFGTGDLGILNYALTLEYLETAFYQDVVKSGLFKGADLARSSSSAPRRQSMSPPSPPRSSSPAASPPLPRRPSSRSTAPTRC